MTVAALEKERKDMILKRGTEENKADFSFGYELLFPLFLNISGGKISRKRPIIFPGSGT